MSDPRYTVDRRIAAPPDAVLAAILHAAGTATRDGIPPAARRGVRGLRGKARGQRFTVWLDDRSEGDALDLRGWVLPAGDGETRVHASVAEDRHAGAIVLALLATAGGFAWLGGGGAWTIVGVAAFLAIVVGLRRAGGSMDHDRASYLAGWLHDVLDRIGTAPAEDAREPVPGAR